VATIKFFNDTGVDKVIKKYAAYQPIHIPAGKQVVVRSVPEESLKYYQEMADMHGLRFELGGRASVTTVKKRKDSKVREQGQKDLAGPVKQEDAAGASGGSAVNVESGDALSGKDAETAEGKQKDDEITADISAMLRNATNAEITAYLEKAGVAVPTRAKKAELLEIAEANKDAILPFISVDEGGSE